MEIISFEKKDFRGDCRQTGSLRAAGGKSVP